MIVVDTNVIAYLLIPGEWTQSAQSLYRKDQDWVSPILWRSEFRNVLAVYMRHDQLDIANALLLMDEAEDVMGAGEFFVESTRVLTLVNESKCSAYDCEFIALAQELGTQLITSDRKLQKSFPSLTVALKEFSSHQPG